MTGLFYKLVEMSLSATWLVLAVIAVRLMLKKAPRWLICGLWGLVALRLLCPFTLESPFSLIPDVEMPQASSPAAQVPTGNRAYGEILSSDGEVLVTKPLQPTEGMAYGEILSSDGEVLVTKPLQPINAQSNSPSYLPHIWVLGMLIMAIYASVSYLRIRKRVQVSIELGNGVYLCDYIATPFILGILRPKIYLPSEMAPADAAYVLAHEKAHLKRRDHWWKPLGYLLLTVYWFNPLLWIAYLLLCRDIELACDEKVIKTMDGPEKKAYSEALLKCSVPRYMIAACPLAFGEVSVKQRIWSVLNYKKPGFWIILVSLLLIAIVAVCFLTEPVQEELEYPFVKDLWTTELIYSKDGDPLWHISSDLLDTINLGQTGGSTIAKNRENSFEAVTLTEENFDAYFEKNGVWSKHSSRKLRQQNVNAWVLHDVFGEYYIDNTALYHDFYYLLQQRNGDLYLTSGTYWTGKYKTGETYIAWVVKLEDALTGHPLTDGDSPYLFTRTLKNEYFYTSDASPNFTTLCSYGADGTQTTEDIYNSNLRDLLRSIPEDAFSLGEPIQDVEVSLFLDINSSSIFDVTLRYGEGKVNMVFSEDCIWSYANTGDKVWIIECEDLNDFFRLYSRNYTLPQSLLEPTDPYRWCQDMDASYLNTARVTVCSSDAMNGAYSLGSSQARQLLSELKKISKDAFVPSVFDPAVYDPNGNNMDPDADYIILSCHLPIDMTNHASNFTGLHFLNGHVYFEFYNTQTNNYRVWEIMDDDFIAYQATLYVLTDHYSPTTEYPTGTLTVSHDYASITIDTYDFLEYEVVDYVDDETPFGIRYRPKQMEEGWVFWAFYPNGFTPDPDWEFGGNGQMGFEDALFDYTVYMSGSHLQAYHYTSTPGDYVMIPENIDHWGSEFRRELEYAVGWNSFNIAGDLLNSDEIMDIVHEELGTLYPKYGTKQFWLHPVFNYHTGIWTIATEEKEGYPSRTVLELDAHGNILSGPNL